MYICTRGMSPATALMQSVCRVAGPWIPVYSVTSTCTYKAVRPRLTSPLHAPTPLCSHPWTCTGALTPRTVPQRPPHALAPRSLHLLTSWFGLIFTSDHTHAHMHTRTHRVIPHVTDTEAIQPVGCLQLLDSHPLTHLHIE